MLRGYVHRLMRVCTVPAPSALLVRAPDLLICEKGLIAGCTYPRDGVYTSSKAWGSMIVLN